MMSDNCIDLTWNATDTSFPGLDISKHEYPLLRSTVHGKINTFKQSNKQRYNIQAKNSMGEVIVYQRSLEEEELGLVTEEK